ncbi:MAG: hypothetical protein J0H49_37785 [Acidobacteria bacterium]|nr:hypothetical protein [Acidobacteriota bacterium]
MEQLDDIKDTLNEFASGLHLEEEELPGIFDAGLLETSQQLEERIAAVFPVEIAKLSLGLRLATKLLVDDPSPEPMALVLNEFGSLVVEMNAELRRQRQGAEWHLSRQYGELAEHLTDAPKPAENQGFKELPRMLVECQWLRTEFEVLAHAAGLNLGRTPFARGFSKASAKRWSRKVGRTPAGRLCAALDHLQHGIEYRARQVWFLRRSTTDEASLPLIYACAHADVFPDFHHSLTEAGLGLEIAKLKGLALGLQLPDFALCFDSADWMAQYALNYLLPPSPGEWAVRQASQLEHLLRSRLSRWYFCAYDHRLEPLEMTAGVLRIGRPLFYERVAAHALLEYSLLQGVAFTRASAPFYVDAMATLELEFLLLFDCYLLRLLYYPRLKAPEGWCDYLGALHALHFLGHRSAELDTFRHVFLARRGLRSALEILYRTTHNHSALN